MRWLHKHIPNQPLLFTALCALLGVVFFFAFISTSFFSPTSADAHHRERIFPKTANYYLGELKEDAAFIDQLARYDLLILTPAQIVLHPRVIESLTVRHNDIIILAYVPSQSYNTTYWPHDAIFSSLIVNDAWWLRDSSGNRIATSPGLLTTDMQAAWAEYLVQFVSERIATLPHVDGIFFDIVSPNISWANGGDIDLDRNGVRDEAPVADSLWHDRTKYFLNYAATHLSTEFLVINGTSWQDLQSFVNGRMFETFPTPWEGGGVWASSMNSLKNTQPANRQPHFMILNRNTNNTGDDRAFSSVRFGMTSSLLEDDTYFSFDYGDANHSQLWWYDEYDIDLGPAVSGSTRVDPGHVGTGPYVPGVWRRDFTHGLALVNSSADQQFIELDGEYEKVRGAQDPAVNTGAIVSETVIAPQDGLLLLRTVSTFDDVVYRSGDFARFFHLNGTRVRNGFFLVDEVVPDGAEVIHTDMNGDGQNDLVVASKNLLTVYRHDGQVYMRTYPYGASYTGAVHITVGDVTGDDKKEIVIFPDAGYALPLKISTYDDVIIRDKWFPFGTKYRNGFSLAIGNIDGKGLREIIVATGSGTAPYVSVYTPDLKRVRQWLAFPATSRGGISVAAGDVNDDHVDEIVVGAGKGHRPLVRVFSAQGKLLTNEFLAYTG